MGEEKVLYRLKKEEIETDITVDYYDKMAYIYSCHKPTKTKLYNLAKQHPDQAIIEKTDEYGVFMKVPINWIKIQPPRKSVPVTEEMKEKLLERFKKNKEEQ